MNSIEAKQLSILNDENQTNYENVKELKQVSNKIQTLYKYLMHNLSFLMIYNLTILKNL